MYAGKCQALNLYLHCKILKPQYQVYKPISINLQTTNECVHQVYKLKYMCTPSLQAKMNVQTKSAH